MKDNTKGSFPFLSILCLIFVVAKIWGYITWSWWWVFSPVLIPFGIVLAVGTMACVLAGVVWCVASLLIWWEERKWKHLPKHRKW